VPFLEDPVELVGVEAGGEGIESGRHGASLVAGEAGVLHGTFSSVLQDDDGQIVEAHSVSAGLDYPGVGPEHSYLRDTGRVRYEAVTDAAALRAFGELSRLEGIIPALEPAHAIAWMLQNPPDRPDAVTLVTLSGRGDKDLEEAIAAVRE
jgi:tryptophan synthase beta chain